jgi:hypothetical protein
LESEGHTKRGNENKMNKKKESQKESNRKKNGTRQPDSCNLYDGGRDMQKLAVPGRNFGNYRF